MDTGLDYKITAALLKSIYEQNLISEDIYNHSLNNLSKTLDYQPSLGYDVVLKEGGSNECTSN